MGTLEQIFLTGSAYLIWAEPSLFFII